MNREDVQFAVNYSHAAAELLGQGRIQFDRWKCPAWPDMIAQAQAIHPAFVHFPLLVGRGLGDAVDGETGQPANWDQIETLLAETGTSFVNVHLAPVTSDYPDISAGTTDPAHVEMLSERMIRDVRAVVRRFGAERVIAENDQAGSGDTLRPAFLPEVIGRVTQETGCGLLLDVAHARIAAHSLGMDPREYMSALPVARIREIHVTGVQRCDGHWVETLQRAGIDTDVIHRFVGNLIDHLPMTDDDWSLFAWAMDQVHSGDWAQPRFVTFEYGGVGPLFEAVTDSDVLAEQAPRLRALVKPQHAKYGLYAPCIMKGQP